MSKLNNRKSDRFNSNPKNFTAGAFANVTIALGDTSCVMSTPLRKKKDVLRKKDAFHPALVKAAKTVHQTWLDWDALSSKKKSKAEEPPKYLTIRKNIEIQVVPNSSGVSASVDDEAFMKLG